MYGPSRLTVPLKRAGERGAGAWQQISWEQALREIAEKTVSIAERHGADSIVHDLGPHFDCAATTVGRVRFFSLMGATLSDDWAEIGDLNIGTALSFGFPHVGGSSGEWFLSDYLVVIDPQYSATTIHADQWLPIAPGSDAALALATARHI